MFYSKLKLSLGLVALYSNRLIQQIAGGLLGLFLPIFLFERFGSSIQVVLLFFIGSFGLYALFVPLGAMIMSRIGLKQSMIWSTLFLVGYFLCFYFLENSRLIFFFLALIFVTLFRMLYWVPYHTDFAQFTDPRNRSKQIAFLKSFASLAGIAIPLAAALIITQLGFNMLFVIATAIAGISAIPLLFIEINREKFSFGWLETFKKLLQEENRKILLAYGADGVESIVGLAIWPIFIYQILNKEYLAVGAISSVIILVTIILRLFIGDLSDRLGKRRLIRVGSVLYAFGWFIRMFIQTAFQIFVIGTYHSFAAIIRRTPFDALMYEQAADRGHYVDEYTVLREVALNTGRVLTLVVMLVLLNFVGINVAFLIAAVASLFINIL